MKTTLLISLCSFAIAIAALGQTPTPLATLTPQPTATVAITSSPTATPAITPARSASPTSEDEDDIGRAVARKIRRHHFGVNVGAHKDVDLGDDAGALMAIPIVGIIFSTLFGAPVLIVAVIMFFSYWKARSLHRTVRAMVEKGQEVPAALFASPPRGLRARSDMRRGVILTAIGIGLIFFFAGVNDGFRGGEWTIGLIPLLIGLGYLAVWKLEGGKVDGGTDKLPPPL